MDYPELKYPALWRDGSDIRGYMPDPGPGPWFTTEQVHAYVDADRAQRAAPGVQGGGEKRGEFEAWLQTKPEARFWNTSDAMLAAWVARGALIVAQQTPPAAAAQQSAQPVATVFQQQAGHPYFSPLVKWHVKELPIGTNLYAAAQPVEVQRVPLTKTQIDEIVYRARGTGKDTTYDIVGLVEAAHGIKPTGTEGGAS